jgi:hypothetical protein
MNNGLCRGSPENRRFNKSRIYLLSDRPGGATNATSDSSECLAAHLCLLGCPPVRHLYDGEHEWMS